QASFFDYDKDGDLDLFLLNHSTVEYSRGSLEVIPLRQKQNPAFTNKLLRNDNGKFTDVTQAAGIYSNVLTFSLGINVTDANNDGWPDIFIGNDFNEPDYLFINNKNGTFTDQIKDRLDHTSMFSMGSDFADYNNDGLLDFAGLDMLPESNHLQKLHAGVDNFDKISMLMNAGLLKQYSRNMLQRNNGDGTYSEIAQMAGVSNTDWSWCPLFFDFDNDGWKDLFISNGYLRDHTDMDFLKFTADEVLRIQEGKQNISFENYLKKMPSISQPNYYFQNLGDGYHFANRTADWGDPTPTVTQGAAYVDLDNDGDLDLVMNNADEYAFVYRNNAQEQFKHNYLKINLKGNIGNPIGIGAKVYVWQGGRQIYQEQNPVRGFQTSVDPIMNFGLGDKNTIDSLIVIWPTDERQVLQGVKTNQMLELRQSDATEKYHYPDATKSQPICSEIPNALSFTHKENNYNDFKTQLLIPYFYSRPGPAMATADVNGDGRTDVFCGGAQGQAGQLFLQQSDEKYSPSKQPAFEADADLEAVDAVFFDVDGDGDADLLVASGAYESEGTPPADRLYRNENGRFVKDASKDGYLQHSSSCVRAVKSNGQVYLFQGGGVKPGRFPEKNAPDQVTINPGQVDSKTIQLSSTGITTDAVWANVCGDAKPDLIIASEWAPVQIFENQGTQFVPRPDLIPAGQSGLWQSILAMDVDGDGDMDLVAGNLGQNSQWHVTPNAPLELYAGDFDANGSVDPLIFYDVMGQSAPFPAMEDLNSQIPPMKKKFIYFKDYADAGVANILNENQLKSANHLIVNTLQSTLFINDGARFRAVPLPDQAQVAPICALESADINHDGNPDLVAAGNMSMVKVKLGSLDGNHGLVLLGDGKGHFEPLSYQRSGLNVRGDVRALEVVGRQLIVGENNKAVRVFRY
ncbi:MAG: VCBS repeat-containing protein, partial [Bacteroidota bacterium]